MPERPDLALLWPSFTFFPLAALGVLLFGTLAGDPVMVVIGLGLLAVNIAIVANQAYFTTLGVEGDELVFRTNFGLQEERVPLGALQRIDAKRYPGAHSGLSAPFFVAATITCAGVMPAATMSAISTWGAHGVLPSVPSAIFTPSLLKRARLRA